MRGLHIFKDYSTTPCGWYCLYLDNALAIFWFGPRVEIMSTELENKMVPLVQQKVELLKLDKLKAY